MIEFALPLLIGTLAALLLFDLRRRSAERHRAELQHIQVATTCLQAHETALREFLDTDVPDPLKVLLIEFSDVLADRAAIRGIVHLLLSRRPSDRPDDALIEALKRLPPEAMRAFASAVLTGTMAGVLRWPETASEFERLSAALLTDPQRDVVTVAEVSRFRRPGVALSPAPA